MKYVNEKDSSPSLFPVEETGGIPLEDVFEAYFECRRKKRGTINALAFEREYESGCVRLWEEINAGTYRPSRSIAFIVTKPVRREIFAADFRDRIVHHLIARRIIPVLEAQFIDDSYSTRKGKGTLYGIRHVEEHIRRCSDNYSRDCYILKVDIRSFFMKISKQRLYDMMESLLWERYKGGDLPLLLFLLRVTIFNRPERGCIRKSPPSSWRGLPRDKSLFHSDGTCGLPIGNLTSQLLALAYLDGLDHLITEVWGVKYYGRYVDDMVLVHQSKEYLLEVKGRIAEWLSARGLTLHPRKVYLQHYTKGVLFIGGMLMPGRSYLSNRALGFCFKAIDRLNRDAVRGAGTGLSEDNMSRAAAADGKNSLSRIAVLRQRIFQNRESRATAYGSVKGRKSSDCQVLTGAGHGGGAPADGVSERSMAYVVEHGEEFVSVINSYLGMARQFTSYKLRRRIMNRIGRPWWRVIYISGHIEKAVLKSRFRPAGRKWAELRRSM